ncbi:hypothetical protein LRE75_23545 [Streptomyces sp. 372A]
MAALQFATRTAMGSASVEQVVARSAIWFDFLADAGVTLLVAVIIAQRVYGPSQAAPSVCWIWG